MNYLILLTTLFFVLGCQDQKVQQQWFLALKSKLPQGWKIEVTDYNQAPFQWEGKNFVGKRLKLWKDSSKETVDLPYSKDNKTYQSEKKIVRYLYEKMQGGYRYKMMERVHPDKVEVITNQFIIITPSNFSFDRDINPGKEIYDIYREVLHKNIQNINPINKDFFTQNSFPQTMQGQKALIYDYQEGMYTSFGVYGL